MKFLFISVGKKHDPAIAHGTDEYTKRISHSVKTEWKLIASSDKEEEGKTILKAIGKNDFVVALDERGKELTTLELAGFLEKRMVAGDDRVTFVVGGAYGLDAAVIDRANLAWSLSKLTLPHQIVRLLLAESLYRALSVVKGEPYHHA